MRLVTFLRDPKTGPRIGVRVGHRVLDIEAASRVDGEPLPATMKALLAAGKGALARTQALARAAQTNAGRFSGALAEEGQIRLLPPVPDADKFLCVGNSHRQHPDEAAKNGLVKEMPQEPTALVKPNSSLVGHDARVAWPDDVARLDYEPELVFVIGKRALDVSKDDAFQHVVGVTILNDLTCSAAGFGPLGPEIITMDEIEDPYDLWMTCAVNGEERMRVNTRDQIWKLPDILEHFSRNAVVEPGDMFSTGAPDGVAAGKPGASDLFLKPGDVIECSIEGYATLRTTIVSPAEVK